MRKLGVLRPTKASITSLLVFSLASIYFGFRLFGMDEATGDQSKPTDLPADESLEIPQQILNSSINIEITTTNPSCQHFLDRAASPGTYYLSANYKYAFEDLPPSVIPKQIFFLHYNDYLEQPRRLCSIESAARQNKDHLITIYARNKPVFDEKIDTWRKNAGLTDRVVVKELVWEEAMIETPLFEWYKNRKWASSKWPEQNLGNAFRLGLLWKYGGVYMDLDIISVNPLAGLGRTVARQDKKNTNNAFFSVEAGDLFIWEVMKEFVSGFRGDKWGHNGPAAVTRTLRKCKIRECRNIELADPMRFFPFNYTSAIDQTYWDETCEKMGKIADESVGIHYWDKRLKNIQDLRKTSIMRITMISHCPALVRTFTHSQLGMRTDDSMQR